MKKLCCINCVEYRKLEKPKIYLLEKTVHSVLYSNCKNEYEKLKEEESMEI